MLRTGVATRNPSENTGNPLSVDVYEGMWHIFQTSPMPETEVSLRKIAAFLHRNLAR